MQSFRTELENPVVEKDIIELEKKIRLFKNGTLDEESFRSLRLARGVYGQRQSGVQMIRIKFPLGIVRPDQLRRLADVAERYSDGNLHITTRQDIQIHHVSLDDTPQLWAELEKDEITLREACGNTVRNITASPLAGVDPNEPFDITPYGWTLFEHFLRNPIGQELGRKFKIALSSSDADTARTYLHDLGLIPKVEHGKRGFKVLLGGGLGTQPFLANTVKDFLAEEDLLNYATAALKVFDQFGERNKRNKARLKFLVKSEGIGFVKDQIEREFQGLSASTVQFSFPNWKSIPGKYEAEIPSDFLQFGKWKANNVLAQKEQDEIAVLVKVRNGNFSTQTARELAELVSSYSKEPIRLTIEQNLIIRSIPIAYLGNVYNALLAIGLADDGAETIKDITSCPGTSTCNLGITSTYKLSEVIEDFLEKEFEEIIREHDIKIKISGCMNSCGQHTVADIGFHGSTIKVDGSVLPALQLILGGSNQGDGKAFYADKVLKFPTKRVQSVLRKILIDFELSRFEDETFRDYYLRFGKLYFYDLIKEIADVSHYEEDELLDWGFEEKYAPKIGVGECAGVKIDLVKTLVYEAEEKIEEARYFLNEKKFNDALYTLYSGLIQGAKAFLVKKGDKTNSKNQIASAFEAYYPLVKEDVKELSYQDFLNKHKAAFPEQDFVKSYLLQAQRFLKRIDELTTAIEHES